MSSVSKKKTKQELLTIVSFNSGNQSYVEDIILPFLNKETMGEGKETCQGLTTNKWQLGLDWGLQEPNVFAFKHEGTLSTFQPKNQTHFV